jgi:hypothetical protein
MPNPVVHFEIVSAEKGQELQRFYAEVFGWKIDANNPMNYGMVDTGSGSGIPGGIGPSMGASRVTIYVAVDDLQAYLDKVEAQGGKTVLPPSDVPGGPRLAMFADPDGNITGLMQA